MRLVKKTAKTVSKKDSKMQLIKKTVRKKDSEVLAEKKFGGVQVSIRKWNDEIYGDFSVSIAGTSGRLEDVKRGLTELKNRVKEVESAISWAEAEIKKLSRQEKELLIQNK